MVIFLRIVAMERMKLVVVDAEMINSNARLPINVFHSLPFVTQRRYIQLAHSSYVRSEQQPVIDSFSQNCGDGTDESHCGICGEKEFLCHARYQKYDRI